MKRSYRNESHTKVILYAVVLVLLCGIGFVVMQDIQVPTEHTTQEVEVNLEK